MRLRTALMRYGSTDFGRVLLLALIVLAFFRLTWALDAKALWWDESLTLQRAESTLWPLLNSTLIIKDGFSEVATTDQHPFFFFLLTGILIRLAGDSEYVLRFISVMAATALVPMVWTFASAMAKRGLVAVSTPVWAAVLAAVSPFLLWFGQEARPYTLWALLALLSTYALWEVVRQHEFQPSKPGKAAESENSNNPAEPFGSIPFRHIFLNRQFIIYVAVVLLFLLTQYYATFLLPLHWLMIWQLLARYNRRTALVLAAATALIGALLGGTLGWYLLSRTGGDNFSQIPLGIILPDILNAFSMGLSVDINRVWWIDIGMGTLALLGAISTVWSARQRQRQGWVLAGLVLVPVAVLLVVNSVHPVYMNARHISLIAGGTILATAAGLGWIFTWRRLAVAPFVLLCVVGSLYSTVNYFTVEEYQKDDFRALARYFEKQMQPGDLVLLNPAASWRIFEYYLPLERISDYNRRNADTENEVPPTDFFYMPLLGRSYEELFSQIDEWKQKYRRVWVIKSGTNPFMDREQRIDPWLDELDNLYRLTEKRFFSHSALRIGMYMAKPPVYNEPIAVEGLKLDVTFGEQIRLIGIHLGAPISIDAPLPVALYWKTLSDTDTRYKSVLRVTEIYDSGAEVVAGITEKEPYEGSIATEYWAPRQTIVEWTEVAPNRPWSIDRSALQLEIQLYPTDSQETQTVTVNSALPPEVTISEDAKTVIIDVR